MRMKLVAMGFLIAIGLCSGCATTAKVNPKSQAISVDAKSNEGVIIGHFKAGDSILIQYVEGVWTPDTVAFKPISPDQKINLDDCRIRKDLPVASRIQIREVWPDGFATRSIPHDTKTKPYTYTFLQECDAYLRINDTWSCCDDNEGTVTYRILKQ